MRDEPQVRALDRLGDRARADVDADRRERPLKPPVGVHAGAAAAARHQQVARPFGQERVQPVEPLGFVDVDPQPPRLAHVLALAARRCARGDAEERLLPWPVGEAAASVGAVENALGVLEQPLKPAALAGGAAGQEVLWALAAVDLHLSSRRPGAGRQLYETAGLGVQHPDLDRPMPRSQQRPGEHAPIGQADTAREPRLADTSAAGQAGSSRLTRHDCPHAIHRPAGSALALKRSPAGPPDPPRDVSEP